MKKINIVMKLGSKRYVGIECGAKNLTEDEGFNPILK